MDDFIELTIDIERHPEHETRPVTVGTRYIVKIAPRETRNKDGVLDKDDGAIVTLSQGAALHVVESYASLKERLRARERANV
jgi:hypothetical protein